MEIFIVILVINAFFAIYCGLDTINNKGFGESYIFCPFPPTIHTYFPVNWAGAIILWILFLPFTILVVVGWCGTTLLILIWRLLVFLFGRKD